MVQTGRGSLGRAVRSLPIGEDEALEIPVFLQDVRQQVFVFTGIVAVHPVVGTHHGRDITLAHADLEGQQVALAHRALVNIHVDRVAPVLLIVQCVVLDVANHVPGFFGLHHGGDQFAGQNRVLAEVFEGAAVTRFARQIHASTQRHVVALGPQLPRNQGPILIRSIQVPTRGAGQIVRKGGGITAVFAAISHSVRCV